MSENIIKNGGTIKTNCRINEIDIEKNKIIDSRGNEINYKKLIWAADTKSLYNMINIDSIKNKNMAQKINDKKLSIANKVGGDSIFTVYITLDVDVAKIKNSIGAHVFYTPTKAGLSNNTYVSAQNQFINNGTYSSDKNKILQWLDIYLKTTTYEISCPALRDISLAPIGQTGLIVSALFDYSIVKHIKNIGFYDEFKSIAEQKVCDVLFNNILSDYKDCVMETFSSTPLSIEKLTSNSDGAITGWAFTNNPIPSVFKLSKVAASIETPIKDVYQAGQWTFSPSGLPISILTGKLASDAIKRKIKHS